MLIFFISKMVNLFSEVLKQTQLLFEIPITKFDQVVVIMRICRLLKRQVDCFRFCHKTEKSWSGVFRKLTLKGTIRFRSFAAM